MPGSPQFPILQMSGMSTSCISKSRSSCSSRLCRGICFQQSWPNGLKISNEGTKVPLSAFSHPLPNINSIKFERCSNKAHRLQDVIERIRTDCILGPPILSRLERVNLQYNNYYEAADPRPIDFLAYLATTPSLKSLFTQLIATFGGSHDFSCLLRHSSNITDLSFKTCKLILEQLGDLVQGLKSLQNDYYYGELNIE